MRFPQLTKKHYIIIAVVAIVALGGFAIAKIGGNEIAIANPASAVKETPKPKLQEGTLSGKECENGSKRPLAVMYASDPEARPLSGIGSADMVIEMPVTEGGVTRMMALFQCEEPAEYGSIRSARMDFIPFVLGFDALYLHWGGEYEALAKLDAGATNNIDCLKFDGTTCRRKSNRPRPHNGFSTPTLLAEKIAQFKYSTVAKELGYKFEEGESEGILTSPTLYAGDFAVRWTYDPATNRYSRFRGGTVERDTLDNLQVQADNVIVMKTTSQYLSILYNRVKTTGSGTMTLYKNGTAVSGTWEKSTDAARLVFKDAQGKELKLNIGTTWIEIATQ
ncbi:MAG: DUF3048 domain-containing protein [Patescibacteria group bacterium]|mgnify:CR=1 FL=1